MLSSFASVLIAVLGILFLPSLNLLNTLVHYIKQCWSWKTLARPDRSVCDAAKR